MQVVAALVGAERRDHVGGRGSAPVRLPIAVPAWADVMQVEVAMPPAAWSGFTDFGLTLFDPLGRQLAVEPIESAVGRLEYEIPEAGTVERVELAFFPAFAEPAGEAPWALDVTVRFFSDSSRDMTPSGQAVARIGAGGSASFRFDFPRTGFPTAAPLVPLGYAAARTGDDVWVTQGALAPGGAN
jgi:hypothetical protein